ncbi:hypothetical protein HU200_034643 [Digitaria exilis]|uniref:RNase H type-1 domain-containing protein n=1 Tax=Digitaria exilis TaxID=1010633 RepID=A0A835BV41_9POAL|nr:hypothetical protein HU200_034643 [Digitaria exilis]
MVKLFWDQMKNLSVVKIPPLQQLTRASDLIDPACTRKENAAMILCGLWALWMARNDRRHDKEPRPVRALIQWATDTTFDLWQMNHLEKSRILANKSPTLERHDAGWFQCNVDASFYKGDRSAASGAILRDHDGRACGGTAKWHNYSLNALTVEALACCDGLQLAPDRGVRRFFFEGMGR